jgi:uncharacterized membrane protein YiaA
LVSAEARLALSEFREVLAKVAIAAGILWFSANVLIIAVALVCVSPFLATIWDAPRILMAIALPVGVGGVLAALGFRQMQAALARSETPRRPGPDVALVAGSPGEE